MEQKIIFRQLLHEILEIAEAHGYVLTLSEVDGFFAHAGLTPDQMELIYQYLEEQKVKITGRTPAAAPAAPAKEIWKCSCGTENTGKFCANCGSPKPAPAVGWTCSCGAVNKGKFCTQCGAKKPADAPLYKCDKCGWEPEDPHNPPKFCPQCGDPFNADDAIG